MFDMLYGGVMQSPHEPQYAAFKLPCGLRKVCAEHESQYWGTEADMIMRDGIISGYIPPSKTHTGDTWCIRGQSPSSVFSRKSMVIPQNG